MKFFVTILFCTISVGVFSQDTNKVDISKYRMVIVDGDTSWVYVFNEMEFKETNWGYRWMVRKVQLTYPYALTAVNILTGLGDVDEEKVSRQVKRDAKKKNKEVKRDFRDAILNMSESEGDVLCKLIYKETGMTAYDIIKKYRGTAQAVYWQSISRLGGANLKQTFDPDKDVLLNTVLKDVESGKVRIPDEPEPPKNRSKKKKK